MALLDGGLPSEIQRAGPHQEWRPLVGVHKANILMGKYKEQMFAKFDNHSISIVYDCADVNTVSS